METRSKNFNLKCFFYPFWRTPPLFPLTQEIKKVVIESSTVSPPPLYIKEYNPPTLESALLGEAIFVPTSKPTLNSPPR